MSIGYVELLQACSRISDSCPNPAAFSGPDLLGSYKDRVEEKKQQEDQKDIEGKGLDRYIGNTSSNSYNNKDNNNKQIYYNSNAYNQPSSQGYPCLIPTFYQ